MVLVRKFVGTIITRRNGFVVAQLRDNNPQITGPNTWAVPGGVMEPRDFGSKRLTATRETFEEMWYLLDPFRLEPLTTDIYEMKKGSNASVSVERTIFTSDYHWWPKIWCREGQAMRFISPDEIESLEFYTGHQNFFRLASERARRK